MVEKEHWVNNFSNIIIECTTIETGLIRSKNQLTKLANISYIKLLAKKSNIPKSWRLSLKNIEIDFLSNFRFSQLF